MLFDIEVEIKNSLNIVIVDFVDVSKRDEGIIVLGFFCDFLRLNVLLLKRSDYFIVNFDISLFVSHFALLILFISSVDLYVSRK